MKLALARRRSGDFGLAASLSLALHGAALAAALLWVGFGTAPEPVAVRAVPVVVVETPVASPGGGAPPAVPAPTAAQPESKANAKPAPKPKPRPEPETRHTAEAVPNDLAAAMPPRKPERATPPVPSAARTPDEPAGEAAHGQPEASPETSLSDIAPAADAATDTATPPRYGVRGLANPKPNYPWLARRAGEEGRVVVRVAVDAQGRADRVEVARSSGHARLDEAALKALRKWRFVPAKRNGHPAPGTVEVPVTFKLSQN